MFDTFCLSCFLLLVSFIFFFRRHCRKGKVGGYRDDLSAEWIEKFDVWSAEKLKNSDFNFVLLNAEQI